jgi:ubiquinone/menaquinone biosynthesis C-methylase UbiE
MEKFGQIEKNKEGIEREENPFEDEKVSQEWIRSVEGEKGLLRDKEIYPRLRNWVENISPEVVAEIGAGQGICSEKCELTNGKYIGVEPSVHLVKRAKELYENNGRSFLVGNAYELPIGNETVDASFSINVWFHLENLNLASKELFRVLKNGASFLIITANPEASKLWESWYEDILKEGKKITGKANIPINPLSKNTFYQHSLQEIEEALKNNELNVEKIESFGVIDGQDVFVSIEGEKC